VTSPPAPRVLAYGMGVDSTALLIEHHARGEAPDLVLTADTGSDKPESYAYLELMKRWMADRSILFEMVRYQPKRFKHWPPYYGIHEMALTNGTLPSISLGRHSCSLKYKKAPQDKFIGEWQPARDAWARGQKVIRLIGFDASPRDTVRYAHAATIPYALYDPQYPLREWGWDRTRCETRILEAGLPVPAKSSCFLCLGMTPDEVRALPAWCLRIIVLVEARAAPRLRTVEGLWRTTSRKRPGRMTDLIRAERLLPEAEVDDIVANAPTQLVAFQERAAGDDIASRPVLANWLERFSTNTLEAL
jgi:hypothetical protein